MCYIPDNKMSTFKPFYYDELTNKDFVSIPSIWQEYKQDEELIELYKCLNTAIEKQDKKSIKFIQDQIIRKQPVITVSASILKE